VRGAFSTRRKMLVNALAQSLDLAVSKEEAQQLLTECRVDPERRAESLSVKEFLCLAAAYAARREVTS
jgi:16S rRNA (adenine1518-N6/adenine1519-N6)-dimethyltransferase